MIKAFPNFLEGYFLKVKSIGIIHKAFYISIKNKKQYTANTKTKAEVSGGGRKPWKQKGTGNARAGSIRSPLWKGGGVSFGPKTRISNKKINKKEKNLAILMSLFLKKNSIVTCPSNILANSNISKTKNIVQLIKDLGLNIKEKNLFVVQKFSKQLYLSSRNIKNFKVITENCLSLFHILTANRIIFAESAIE